MQLTLPIQRIRRDGGTQPRAQADPAVVHEYAETLLDGQELPPVQVYYDGTDYWLSDGFHRAAAHEQVGHTEIQAAVIQGTRRDAVLASCAANASHGLRRTAEDKRRAVTRLLTDPEWQLWSDREIARRCCVGNRFVGDIRRELCPDTVGGARKFERGGQTLTMDTGNIGQSQGDTYQVDTLPPGCGISIVITTDNKGSEGWDAWVTMGQPGRAPRVHRPQFDDDKKRAKTEAEAVLAACHLTHLEEFLMMDGMVPFARDFRLATAVALALYGFANHKWPEIGWATRPFPQSGPLGVHAAAHGACRREARVPVYHNHKGSVYRWDGALKGWKKMQILLEDDMDLDDYLRKQNDRDEIMLMHEDGELVASVGRGQAQAVADGAVDPDTAFRAESGADWPEWRLNLVGGFTRWLDDGKIDEEHAERMAAMGRDQQLALYDAAIDAGILETDRFDWDGLLTDWEWSAQEGRAQASGDIEKPANEACGTPSTKTGHVYRFDFLPPSFGVEIAIHIGRTTYGWKWKAWAQPTTTASTSLKDCWMFGHKQYDSEGEAAIAACQQLYDECWMEEDGLFSRWAETRAAQLRHLAIAQAIVIWTRRWVTEASDAWADAQFPGSGILAAKAHMELANDGGEVEVRVRHGKTLWSLREGGGWGWKDVTPSGHMSTMDLDDILRQGAVVGKWLMVVDLAGNIWQPQNTDPQAAPDADPWPQLVEVTAVARYSVVVFADSEKQAIEHVQNLEWECALDSNGVLVGVNATAESVRPGTPEDAHEVTASCDGNNRGESHDNRTHS